MKEEKEEKIKIIQDFGRQKVSNSDNTTAGTNNCNSVGTTQEFLVFIKVNKLVCGKYMD